MNWSRQHTLFAGLALIILTNAIALGGAAYNRSGEPESKLSLTERELRSPFIWSSPKENSGLALQLQWRVLQLSGGIGEVEYYGVSGGSPAWLDAPKMASLGFDVKTANKGNELNRYSRTQRDLPRDVLVVLELDGPAYREAIARTQRAAKEVEAKNERGEGKKASDKMNEREARWNSRLFAVDAGLDQAQLRSKYPDRSKYAIVHAQVRPVWASPGESPTAGTIENLNAAEINVPLELRAAFEGIAPASYGETTAENKRFEMTLAFGQRLEPWLISALKK